MCRSFVIRRSNGRLRHGGCDLLRLGHGYSSHIGGFGTVAVCISKFEDALSSGRAGQHYPAGLRLDHFDELTLRSTFELAARNYEVIFCAAREGDAAVPLVRRLIDDYPHISARLLIGDERPPSQP